MAAYEYTAFDAAGREQRGHRVLDKPVGIRDHLRHFDIFTTSRENE